MKCLDCKFWNRNGAPDTGAAEPPGARKRCLKVLHTDPFGDGATVTTDLAVLTDGSGYAASLWTAWNFGCLLFEPRPE